MIPRPPSAVPGGGAWWDRPGAAPASITVGDVRSALASWRGGSEQLVLDTEVSASGSGASAVLCVVYAGAGAERGAGRGDGSGAAPGDAGEARVVLTRRSSSLRTHTGEVSFPGGRLDPGESPREAALREAGEEVGLDPSSVEVLGALSSITTFTHRFPIIPFVGVVPARPTLKPNPSEVARVFSVALSALTSASVYHDELWPVPSGVSLPGPYLVHFFDVDGETIWGATARILRELLDLACAAAVRRAAGVTEPRATMRLGGSTLFTSITRDAYR